MSGNAVSDGSASARYRSSDLELGLDLPVGVLLRWNPVQYQRRSGRQAAGRCALACRPRVGADQVSIGGGREQGIVNTIRGRWIDI